MPALASGQGPTIHGRGQKWLAATKASNDASHASIVRFFATAALGTLHCTMGSRLQPVYVSKRITVSRRIIMRTILASAAAVLALVASPAVANTETVEVRVSVADLDLNTAAGRTALEERVAREARKVCKIEAAFDRAPEKTDWDCVEAAKSAALAKVDRDQNTDVAMAAE
jgi:UrcA family protein